MDNVRNISYSLESALDLMLQGYDMCHSSEPDCHVYIFDSSNRRRVNIRTKGLAADYLVSIDYFKAERFKIGWKIWKW